MNEDDSCKGVKFNIPEKKPASPSRNRIKMKTHKTFNEVNFLMEMNKIEIEEFRPLCSIQPKPMKDDIIPSPLILASKNDSGFKVSSMTDLLESNNTVNSCPNSDIEKDLKNSVSMFKIIRKELFQSKRRTNRILSNQETRRKNSSDEEEEVIHINLGEGENEGDRENNNDDDDEYYLLREETDAPPQFPNKHYSTSILTTMKNYI